MKYSSCRSEREKRTDYAQMFRDNLILYTHYYTFAIEHGGRLGPEAFALLHKFALHKQACLGHTTDRLLNSGKLYLKRWLQCLSVTFQNAQSLRIKAALDRIFTGYGNVYQVRPNLPRYSLPLHSVQRLFSVY